MLNIYKLEGRLQQYVWGGEDYIPHLFHIPKQKGQCYAEWWLGAHSSAPAIIETEKGKIALDEFIKQNPFVLGEKSRADFADELPYLLKVLDVKKPLSIQLHPTKKQAELGFALENQQGIALTDPKRTYKDNNHKPEMMIALSDFWLLHGFKTKKRIIDTLKSRSSLATLVDKLKTQDLHQFYADIMQADQEQLALWLLPIIQENQSYYAQNKLSLENPDYWLLYSMDTMNISQQQLDAGLICFYLFNIVHIKQGEGIYQDAGIPHAYLRGQNIELMACSDNVIRGGLTPKHIDITALLEVIDCREVEPEIIAQAPANEASFTYTTPAKDFALERISYVNEQIKGKTASATILLVMSGRLEISSNCTALTVSQGESVFLCADTEYCINGIEDGYCILAKLP